MMNKCICDPRVGNWALVALSGYGLIMAGLICSFFSPLVGLTIFVLGAVISVVGTITSTRFMKIDMVKRGIR